MSAALYEQVWDHPEYGNYSPGEHFADVFVSIAKPDARIIDFGCGSGKGTRLLEILTGQEVIGLDWAENAPKLDIKFRRHDLTQPLELREQYGFCTDVMEHIAPDDVNKVLLNILEAARFVFFSIATYPDHFGAKVGEPLHLTVQPYDWWLEKLRDDLHCKIIWSKDDGPNALFYVTAYADGDFFTERGRLNTEESALYDNIRANLRLGLQEIVPHGVNDQPIILLAGGPSLAEHEAEIIERGRAGEAIVTTNGAYNWLLERGIKPAAQVMIDARAFNRRFVTPIVDTCKYLICSQCDHEVLKSLPPEQTWLWHSGNGEVVQRALDDHAAEEAEGHEWYPVHGGTTVVSRALVLLAMLGFRNVEVFGWDSCLMDDKHHAYAQPENDGAKIIEIIVGGRTFRCHPWMIVQANEVSRLVRYVLGKVDGFNLAVRGDGLIAHMLQHAATLAERSDGNGC